AHVRRRSGRCGWSNIQDHVAAGLLRQRSEMTALITGASSGIGLEMARICAAERRDVVLVARSARNLAELAAALEREHDVRAYVIAADLASSEGIERIVSRVAE